MNTRNSHSKLIDRTYADNTIDYADSPWKISHDTSTFTFIMRWPITFLLWFTLPDCRKHPRLKMLTFFMCIVWIGITSYTVAMLITIVGKRMKFKVHQFLMARPIRRRHGKHTGLGYGIDIFGGRDQCAGGCFQRNCYEPRTWSHGHQQFNQFEHFRYFTLSRTSMVCESILLSSGRWQLLGAFTTLL